MLLVSRPEIALTPLPPTARSLAEDVMERVRDAVYEGQLTPGVLYSGYQLAEELGVSRSPVREALLRLAEVGLVRFERNRGFRIVLPSPQEIAEIFAIRLALELPAVRRVAGAPHPALQAQLRQELSNMERSATAGNGSLFSVQDQRLHDLVLAAAGNTRARTIVNDLRDTTRLLGATSADRSRSLPDIHAEHRPVVEAILRADPAAADRALRWHLVHTGKLLVEQVAREHSDPRSTDQIWAEHCSDTG